MSSTAGSRARAAAASPASPASVAGPGTATNDARPRRTWTSSARIESAISSGVSAPMSMPAGARSAASRSSGTCASSRSQARTTPARVGDATRPTYETSRRNADSSASSSQIPWVATTTYGDSSLSTRAIPVSAITRSAPGNADSSATGSHTVTRQPVAPPSEASAATIGVVPASHSDGAGRCGST